jgi:hypothetical protein
MCIQIANAERLAMEAAARVFEPPPAAEPGFEELTPFGPGA